MRIGEIVRLIGHQGVPFLIALMWQRNIDLHFLTPEFESVYHLPIDRAGTYRLTATFEADYTSADYSVIREFLVN